MKSRAMKSLFKTTAPSMFLPSMFLAALLATVAMAGATAAEAGQRLTLEKNHTLRVSLRGSAGSVIVGNPDIADVSIIDSRTLYIIGKGFGSSAVTVTDGAGRPLFDGEIVVTAAQRNAITVYKGLQPSSVVCTDICVSSDGSTTSGSGSSSDPAPASPLAMNAAAPH